MGMSLGSSKAGALSEMNVVPLIDILLVLLIIFMVITPLSPKGLTAIIPQPAPNVQRPQPTDQETVVVQVLENGKLRINGEDTTWAVMGSRLQTIFKDRADKIAFVKGDNDVLFADMARAIDIMSTQGGITKVGLITKKLEEGQ
jgi:biopolymer transport protein ExbD